MRSYVFISITALYFYTFLMLAFMSAKKSRLIRDFIAVLGAMILWTGGPMSCGFMFRCQESAWCHVRFSALSGISAAIRQKAPIKYGWCSSFW